MSINGGFRLGGRAALSFGIRMTRESQRPVLPGTVDRVLDIPGRNGQRDMGADMGPRPFALSCHLIRQDAATLQQAVSDLAAFLVDQYGKPRTMDLIFDFQPDRLYKARYSGSLPIDRIVGLGQFVLPLVAFDSHALAVETDVYQGEITSSPESWIMHSNSSVVVPTWIELTNEGETTIAEFTIQVEFDVEG